MTSDKLDNSKAGSSECEDRALALEALGVIHARLRLQQLRLYIARLQRRSTFAKPSPDVDLGHHPNPELCNFSNHHGFKTHAELVRFVERLPKTKYSSFAEILILEKTRAIWQQRVGAYLREHGELNGKSMGKWLEAHRAELFTLTFSPSAEDHAEACLWWEAQHEQPR